MKGLRFLAAVLLFLTITQASFVSLPGVREAKADPVPLNYALSFDGTDDFVEVSHNSSLNVRNGISLEAWVKRDSVVATDWITILEKDRDIYALKITPGNEFIFILRFADGRVAHFWSRFFSWEVGLWYHLAGTYNGTVVSVYIDGILRESYSGEGVGNALATSSSPIHIGMIADGDAQREFFNGTIDEVRIWNYCRNESEIRSTMHAKLAGNEPGLIGCWSFDEGSGQNTFDATDNHNDGQLGSTLESDNNDPGWTLSGVALACTQFNFLSVTITVKNTAGTLIENAEVSAFSEEWGIVYPSRDYGERTNSQGIAKLKIFSGNWTFFASWGSGNRGLYAVENVFVDGNTSLTLRTDSTVNVTIYDFYSNPMDQMDVRVIDKGHIPMFRFPQYCGTTDSHGFLSLEVKENLLCDLVVGRGPPAGISDGEAFLFHIKDVQPPSNVVYTAHENELSRIDFDIFNETEANGLHSDLFVQIPSVSLYGCFHFWRDQNILWDNLTLWMTPEYARFSVSEYDDGWAFDFLGEDIHLEAGIVYDQIYGGNTSVTVLLYPEFDSGRQIWLFVEDQCGHVMHGFHDDMSRSIAPIELIDPDTNETVYQGELNLGALQTLIPVDPRGYFFKISLNLGFFGSFNLSGAANDHYVSLGDITSEHFKIFFPEIFREKASKIPEYADQVYELMSMEVGHEIISDHPDGKIHVYFTLWHPGWCGGATIGMASGWLFHPLEYPEPALKGAFQHELAHSFQWASKFSITGIYGEAYASFWSAVVHTDRYGSRMGLYYQSTHCDNFFRYLEGDESIDVYWRMFFLLVYLNQRYSTKIHRDFIQLWTNSSLIPKQKLIDAGFNEDETIAILYSYLAGENLAWLFRIAGINVQNRRVVEGLGIIDIREAIHLVIVDSMNFKVTTVSNSRVLYFGFSKTEGILFDVIGVSNILGHCNVTVPRDLLDGHFSVVIDDIPVAYLLLQNSTHNFVYFAYYQSAHHIQVIATHILAGFPSLTVISPQNDTYPTNDVPLTFTISETTSWIGYSLDGQANVTINGNMTLVDLFDGPHQVIVYANDTIGNMGASNAVCFAVDTTPPNVTDVSQTPIEGNVLPENEVEVNATVTDCVTGVEKVTLIYAHSNSSGSWIGIIDMTNIEGNVWSATIPAFPISTNVTYAIIAEDHVGNKITTEELGYQYQYHVVSEFTPLMMLSLLIFLTLLVVVACKKRPSTEPK